MQNNETGKYTGNDEKKREGREIICREKTGKVLQCVKVLGSFCDVVRIEATNGNLAFRGSP